MFSLNNYFSKCGYINLDKRIDRKNIIEDIQKKFNSNFDRFSAIEGNGSYDARSRACFMSHMNLIKQYIGYNNILIMEDDMFLIDDIKDDLELIMEEFINTPSEMLFFFGNETKNKNKKKYISFGYAPTGAHFYCIKNPLIIYNYLNEIYINTPPTAGMRIDMIYKTMSKYHFCVSVTNYTYSYQYSSFSDLKQEFRDSTSSSIIKDLNH